MWWGHTRVNKWPESGLNPGQWIHYSGLTVVKIPGLYPQRTLETTRPTTLARPCYRCCSDHAATLQRLLCSDGSFFRFCWCAAIISWLLRWWRRECRRVCTLIAGSAHKFSQVFLLFVFWWMVVISSSCTGSCKAFIAIGRCCCFCCVEWDLLYFTIYLLLCLCTTISRDCFAIKYEAFDWSLSSVMCGNHLFQDLNPWGNWGQRGWWWGRYSHSLCDIRVWLFAHLYLIGRCTSGASIWRYLCLFSVPGV